MLLRRDDVYKLCWYVVVYAYFLHKLISAHMGIFTRGYPFTLQGDGYGEKLYPLAGMGTGDG